MTKISSILWGLDKGGPRQRRPRQRGPRQMVIRYVKASHQSIDLGLISDNN